MKRWCHSIALIAVLLASGSAGAASFFARTGGAFAGTNWNAANMWSNTSCAAGGPVAATPTAADDVTICNGKAVTVNVATANAGSITIEGGNLATSLTIAGANVLSVTNASGRSGNVVIAASTAAVTKQLAVNAGTLNVTGSVTVNGGTTTNNVNNIAQLAVTTGTASVNGAMQITAGTATTYVARVTLTTGSITVGGNVDITGGTAATADALINVTGVSAATGFTVGGALNINATVATSSSVTLAAGSLMSVSGNINNGDTLSVGAGTLTMLPLGGTTNTLTTTNAGNIAVLTSVTSGTINAHNATVNSGAGAAGLKRMQLNGTGTINVAGNLSVTSAASTGSTATADVTNIAGLLNVTGAATVTGGTAAGRNALLNISTASNAGRGIAIGGALNINSTVAATASVTLSAAGLITVGGNINNGDTLTVGTGTLTMLPVGGSNTLTTSSASNIAVTTSVTNGTINAHNAVVNSGVGATALKRMNVGGTGTINVAGNLTVTAATSTGGDATVDVTNIAGLLNVTGATTITGGTAAAQNALLSITAGSNAGRGVTIGGALNINSTVATTASVTLAGGVAPNVASMTVGGNINNGDVLSVGTGTLSMLPLGGTANTLTTTNAANIAVNTSVTTGTINAHNVTVDSGVGATALKRLNLSGAGTINVGGNLNITSATSTGGDATVDVTNAAGLLAVTGNVTVTGATVAGRNALLNVSTASNVGRGITIGGSLTTTSSLLGTAVVSLTTAGGRLTVNGAGGVSNGDTINVGPGTFSSTNASGTYTNSSASIVATTTVSTGSLTVAGPLTNATAETITLSSTGSITIGGLYTNTGTTTITTTGVVNANGGFSNTGTFTNSAAGQLFMRGTPNTINGTFNRGTGTATMNGTASQALSGSALTPPSVAAAGFNNLVINNAAGVTLSGNVSAKGVITFTSGEVTTGANILIAEANCAGSIVRTSGHVVGNLQKTLPAGNSTCVYQVGVPGEYMQVSLALVGAAAGRMIGSVTAGDHPNIATSGLDSAKSVNRWWTLTTTGVVGAASASPGTYGATFTFVNPASFDAGANTANFETERWTGAAWATTTAGTRTATTTQATGLTALGQFAVAEKKAVVPTPGRFNAFEPPPGTAITGNIKTKISGVAFSLAAVAVNGAGTAQLTTFTDTVAVDLLGNNTLGVALDANNCPTTFTVVQTLAPNPTITSGVATINFPAVADSWRDVRVRIRWPAAGPFTVTSCSSNNFAIRPNAITGLAASNNTRTTAGTTNPLTSTAFGAVLHNAGRPFSVRASAVNGAGSPVVTANYAGTPVATVTTCGPGVGFEACTATQATLLLTTTFASGQLVSDVATYNDVGSFNLQLIDDTFASVDNADSTLAERRIQSAVVPVGRFVPDNFAVAFNVPVFAPACTGFTYQGQSFNYSTAPVITVTAREAGGATTTRYTGNWWRLTNSSLTPVTQAARYAAASGTLDTTGLPAVTADPAIVDGGGGAGSMTFSGGTGLRFTRNNATPAAELNAEIALSINVIDADGVTLATNPAAFGAATAGNGILFSDGNALTTNDKRVRYGRLQLGGGSGSQQIALRAPIEAQYWNGTAFVTNTLDSCTTLSSVNIGLGNFAGNLNAGETTATISASPLQSGRSAIQLSAPGANNQGSVDITLNLGTTPAATADACPAFAPTATAANLAYLRGRWCGASYVKDPAVRVRFGVMRSSDQAIYRREQ